MPKALPGVSFQEFLVGQSLIPGKSRANSGAHVCQEGQQQVRLSKANSSITSRGQILSLQQNPSKIPVSPGPSCLLIVQISNEDAFEAHQTHLPNSHHSEDMAANISALAAFSASRASAGGM